MQQFRGFISQHRMFAGFLSLFITGVAFPSILIPREHSFFWLNFFHCKTLDAFFIACTFIGDGVFSLFLALFLFFLNNRLLAFRILLAFLVSGMIAQVLKKMVHLPRPMAALGSAAYPYFIEGVTHSGYNSFPSGHTTSAFALALLCCLHTRKRGVQALFFSLACMTGYSRIYLGQHFLPDVFAGMLIGSSTAVVVYALAQSPFWLKKKDRLPDGEHMPA
ncbi:phosphatase PAP2 family protein [Niabella drilacis]|uniref:Membrane-associated phospholipid phosphatase n=1 Tax=Niabella drilacis (strain DSM 25811 / CCM 8410 / CCUG 62505 / LMG 26954 / E90) TaxID=1285928 RepID=A0A1G7APL3_NIADE|nr:phosphatase PAP2 family protein [Niabella drilacis]SDE16417.1 Membrane-associated phospholipid phosphatase [Niabella drilacis]